MFLERLFSSIDKMRAFFTVYLLHRFPKMDVKSSITNCALGKKKKIDLPKLLLQKIESKELHQVRVIKATIV